MGVLIFIVLSAVTAWLVHTGQISQLLVLILLLFYGKDPLENRIVAVIIVSTLTVFFLGVLRMSLLLIWLSFGVWGLMLQLHD